MTATATKNARILQLESDYASLGFQARALAEKSVAGTLTAEESTSFDEIVGKLNACKDDLQKETERFEAVRAVLEVNDTFNRPATDRRSGPSLDTRTDPRGADVLLSPGQKFVKSDNLDRAIKSSTGIMRHDPVVVGSLFPKYGPDWVDGMSPEEIRAVITSTTAPGSALLPQVLPTIYRGAEKPLVMRDVLLNFQTTSDTITVMQESGFTNAAVEVAEATSPTTGAKPESDLTFTEVNYPVRWIAHWMQITRQMLEDLAFMRGYIDQRLLIGLARREDNQILNGNGVAPNLTGILTTSGIQTLDAAYFTANPVKSAGFDNENINRIRRAKTKVMITGDAMPTFLVANPTDVEEWETVTDANRQYLIGSPFGPDVRRLWGLPIIESQNIAAKTVLVGDGSMAAVVDRMQSRIYTTDSHSDYFIRNLFVILAEERLAVPVFRPSAFVKVTLA